MSSTALTFIALIVGALFSGSGNMSTNTFDPYKIEIVGIDAATATDEFVELLESTTHVGPTVSSLEMKIHFSPTIVTGTRTHFNLRIFQGGDVSLGQTGTKIPVKELLVHQDPDDPTEWDADIII